MMIKKEFHFHKKRAAKWLDGAQHVNNTPGPTFLRNCKRGFGYGQGLVEYALILVLVVVVVLVILSMLGVSLGGAYSNVITAL
jgi:pilus assembly protein Flp/PilA